MLGNREEKDLDPGFCPVFHHQHVFLAFSELRELRERAPWRRLLGWVGRTLVLSPRPPAVQTSAQREAGHRGSHRSVQSAAGCGQVWPLIRNAGGKGAGTPGRECLLETRCLAQKESGKGRGRGESLNPSVGKRSVCPKPGLFFSQ